MSQVAKVVVMIAKSIPLAKCILFFFLFQQSSNIGSRAFEVCFRRDTRSLIYRTLSRYS